MSELILHLLGDYVTQSDWMANEKTKQHGAALAHTVIYSLPFLLLRPSVSAFLVILGTHFLIDRYRLARYVVYAKNWIAPTRYWYPWTQCSATGYHADRPTWLAVWLLIAADNTLHLAINHLALRFL